MAAITITELKLHLGISGTTYDTRLTAIIAQTQAAAEVYCNCKFDAADYVQYLDSYGSRHLYLPWAPPRGLNSVKRVVSARTAALRVKYTGAAGYGIVRVNRTSDTNHSATSLTLVTEGAADDTTTITTETLNDMVTAIAAVSGWTASVEYSEGAGGSHPAADLIPCPGIYARNVDAVLEIPDDRGRIGTYDMDGLALVGCWPEGVRNLRVDYNAGFSTAPDDLKYALILLCAEVFQGSQKDGTVQSETLGAYSYTLAGGDGGGLTGQLSSSMARLVAPYRRRML